MDEKFSVFRAELWSIRATEDGKVAFQLGSKQGELPLRKSPTGLLQLGAAHTLQAHARSLRGQPLNWPHQIVLGFKVDAATDLLEQHPIAAGLERIGKPSDYACPECHGVLLELKDGSRTKFRCHTGHAYSIASLLAAIAEGIEDSLWNAVRALEEGQLLMMRMAEHLEASHDGTHARELIERANEARHQSESIRKLVMQREPLSEANKS